MDTESPSHASMESKTPRSARAAASIFKPVGPSCAPRSTAARTSPAKAPEWYSATTIGASGWPWRPDGCATTGQHRRTTNGERCCLATPLSTPARRSSAAATTNWSTLADVYT
ncbi:hypothetical protein M885DRAFT_205343 [Pelagophyceae sp. CCMP2097]|nr:hypothetical protein M885DRAFT_205343 [Pelagophyceae sp. CCMP2097]